MPDAYFVPARRGAPGLQLGAVTAYICLLYTSRGQDPSLRTNVHGCFVGRGLDPVSYTHLEEREVVFTLTPQDISRYRPELQAWCAAPGRYEIRIGHSSRDIRAVLALSLIHIYPWRTRRR